MYILLVNMIGTGIGKSTDGLMVIPQYKPPLIVPSSHRTGGLPKSQTFKFQFFGLILDLRFDQTNLEVKHAGGFLPIKKVARRSFLLCPILLLILIWPHPWLGDCLPPEGRNHQCQWHGHNLPIIY